MNRRIRSIFWLMTICIVGINAFQGYWLWTTYQLNRRQFVRTAEEALFRVLEGQQISEARRLFRENEKGGSKRTAGEAKVIIRHFETPDEGSNRIFYKLKETHSTQIDSGFADSANGKITVSGRLNKKPNVPLQLDSMAKRISDLVVLGWTENGHVNLNKIEKKYREALKQQDIETEFKLDTLIIKPTRGENDFLVFESPIHKTTLKSILQTSPLPVNPVKHLFIQASFSVPMPYLLLQMGWLLGSSLFLLLLTTGCFLFMLNTILRQKKLSEIKNDFINNMTHELKTPLATVTAAVEALRNFGVLNDPVKTQTYLSVSENNLRRLSDLVEKVLNLAVDESRELELQKEHVNLAALTAGVVSNHQLRASKFITFDMNIPAETTVLVDPIHFSNVLNNLIDNAVNYSYDKVKIGLSFRERENGWRLSVSDNGIGIPKIYQSAVFDRFFRVPTGNLHPVKGFGLGLAYVQQVVERHGGKISVSSEPGNGSEFLLDF